MRSESVERGKRLIELPGVAVDVAEVDQRVANALLVLHLLAQRQGLLVVLERQIEFAEIA